MQTAALDDLLLRIPFSIINAFADKNFDGNPAAVMIIEGYANDRMLLKIAQKLDQPVTSFIFPTPNRDSVQIRWFTRNMELKFCGHGTLAASHLLFSEGESIRKRLIFSSLNGEIVASTDGKCISLIFRLPKVTTVNDETKIKIEKALGVKIREGFASREDYIALVDTEVQVTNFVPNFELIAALECRGIVLTAQSGTFVHGEKIDFVSRFFSPRIMIDEDQVCVSAHCELYSIWSKRLHKQDLCAWQASPSGGILHLHLVDNERVQISGPARIYSSGTLSIVAEHARIL